MAREQEFRARDKKAHKMTRDGLVEQNLATGEEQRISQRGQDFQLRAAQMPGGAPSGDVRQTDSVRQTGSVRQAIADAGRGHSGHTRRQPPPTDVTNGSETVADTQNSGGVNEVLPMLPVQPTEAPARAAPGASPASGDSRRDSGHPSGRPDRRGEDGGRYSEDAARPSEQLSDHVIPEEPPGAPRPADSRPDTGRKPHGGERGGRLRFGEAEKPAPRGPKARQHGTQYQRKFADDSAHPTEPFPQHETREASPGVAASDTPRPADSHPDTGRKPRGSERPGRLRYDEAEKAVPSGSKARQHGTQYQRKFTDDAGKTGTSAPSSGVASPDGPPPSDEPRPSGSPDSRGVADGKRSRSKGSAKKRSKLEFSKGEQPPGADVPNKKVEKTRQKAEKSAVKLEDAKKKLPTRRRARLNREFDPKKGKAVRKFRFEEEVKPQRAHVKGPLPFRPVKAGANAGIVYAHKKIHEVEHENVGVEAAHKGELLAEGALRRAYHMNKTRPYRRVRKLQKKATKRAVNHAYQKALADNPKLGSNMLSRMMQKRKIKRQYAKAAREAKRAGNAVQKAGSLTAKLTRAVAGIIRRHPVVFGVLALVLLMMFLIMGFFSSCSNMAAGGLSSIVASSYLAEDADIDNAELSYTEWETDLQFEVMNAEATHPGFDEYRYSVDDIGHNPYELMAFLTSAYQDFTYSGIQAVLREIFNEQYQLSFVEEIEVRYRTEYYTDEDGDEHSYEVPYNYYILNINLTARSFSEVIASRLDSDQREIFGLLMTTKGNRQYLTNPFDFNWLPYVSSYYGYRVHPVSGAKDYHKGVDIAVAEGTEIRAGHDGRVTSAGNAGDYGLVVVLDDGKGLVSKYAHCSELLVSAGQEVKKGDIIAKVGNTGNSTGSHLHLEIIKDGQYLNAAYFAETGDDGTSGLLPGSPGGPVIPDYPGAPMDDGSFAALMEEAQKHLGKSYVFGASGPNTFDCSGFVSYVLNHSGVASVGRQTAQGLYNMTTPVSAANAQPGDLIFFHSTYSTSSAVTHIGIYIGNGQMIHAGNPVQYASINTRYWQEHFYAYGRLSD